MTVEPVNYKHAVPHRPDGASRRATHALRRRRTLAAATEVFASQGYHLATMAEIAHRTGWSKPILYKQFSGKLELYLAVLQEHIDALTRSVQHALHSTKSNRGRVYAAVQAYFDFVDHETQGFRLIFDSDVTSEPAVQWRVGRAIDDSVNAITDTIANDAMLNLSQARLLAAGLVGASQFGAKYWLDTGCQVPKAEAVAAIATLCWGGLASVPLDRLVDENSVSANE
ncbi:TetR/AcrR family transcriptional regulator [Nocardia tengchongensis]|uniref:TetR/AcrR family transcriptional regulator n=1 Tax=Nocardia tengchongensis TaxID=2055889 RepID=UPI0036B7C97E